MSTKTQTQPIVKPMKGKAVSALLPTSITQSKTWRLTTLLLGQKAVRLMRKTAALCIHFHNAPEKALTQIMTIKKTNISLNFTLTPFTYVIVKA